MNTTTKSPARIKLEAAIASKSTDMLIQCHGILDAKATRDEAERLTAALMADEITRRLDLDAKLDDVFGDEDFHGTYHDAILRAMAA